MTTTRVGDEAQVETERPNVPDRDGPKTLRAAVSERAAELARGYRDDDAGAIADLARLRKGAGKLPQDTPELWGSTCDPADYAQEPWSVGDDEERAERAVHVALTLFALHQQSRREKAMHWEGVWISGKRRERDLGWAVRELMPHGKVDETLRHRLVHAGKATSIDSLAERLRAIVQLLRRDAIPLDYGLLAQQLLTAQRPGGMSEVRRSWGRGFQYHRPAQDSGDAPDGPVGAHGNENENENDPAPDPA